MQTLTMQEVTAAMEGRIHGPDTPVRVTGVSTDSRTLRSGELFFAIRGERFDGHAYAGDVLDRGAAGVVVSDTEGIAAHWLGTGRVIQVPDTVAALGRLAAWYRRQMAAQVIAVAGSNGKTTTKDLIAAVLSSRRRGRPAPASFNNSIGVPLTLLSVDPSDEFVVVEIGTNHPGEVAALARLCRPDLAVITSIGEEHLEFFGSVEAVAAEEFSLLGWMAGRGFVAMSDQAAGYAPAELPAGLTRLIYGMGESCDLRAEQIEVDGGGQKFRVNGRFDYRVGIPGRHNVVNALAAIAVGMRLRLDPVEIAAALPGAELPPMRLQRLQVGPVTVINDAYNANPSSMRAAFETLDHWPDPGRKVLLLGDMRELGERAEAWHREVGREAGRSKAAMIIAVGSYGKVIYDGATSTAGTTRRIYSYPSVEALAPRLGELIQPGDVVLLKASRGSRLERVLEPLGRALERQELVAGGRR